MVTEKPRLTISGIDIQESKILMTLLDNSRSFENDGNLVSFSISL